MTRSSLRPGGRFVGGSPQLPHRAATTQRMTCYGDAEGGADEERSTNTPPSREGNNARLVTKRALDARRSTIEKC
jgi:hypothetical protein